MKFLCCASVIVVSLVAITKNWASGEAGSTSLPDTTALLAAITLDGGAEVQPVIPVTLNSGSSVPEYQASLSSPHKIKDLVVRFVRMGSVGTGPIAGVPAISVDPVAEGLTATESTAANVVAVTQTTGTPPTTVHVGFEVKIPCLATKIEPGVGSNLKINVGQNGSANDYQLRVQPSLEAGTVHADLLENVVVKGALKSGNRSTGLIGNEDIIVHVDNANSDVDVIELKGDCKFTGTGASLSGVALVDPSANYSAVANANVTTSGNSYAITGFSLNPDKTYAVIFTSPVEPEAVSVKIEAVTD